MKIYLSPDGGDGGGNLGGAGDTGTPAGAPAGGAGEAGSAASQYVSKADFDSFSSRMEQNFSRFSQPAREPAKAESGEAKELSRPKLKDYNFGTSGAPNEEDIERYNNDVFSWQMQGHSKKESERVSKEKATEAQQATQKGHVSRVGEYRKTNPEFDADLRKAGAVNVFDDVKNAIFRHKQSPAIVHHLVKTPGLSDELNTILETDGQEAVMFRIGEIASEIANTKKLTEAQAKGAGTRPIPFSNRGSNIGGKTELSNAERVKRYKEKA